MIVFVKVMMEHYKVPIDMGIMNYIDYSEDNLSTTKIINKSWQPCNHVVLLEFKIAACTKKIIIYLTKFAISKRVLDNCVLRTT